MSMIFKSMMFGFSVAVSSACMTCFLAPHNGAPQEPWKAVDSKGRVRCALFEQGDAAGLMFYDHDGAEKMWLGCNEAGGARVVMYSAQREQTFSTGHDEGIATFIKVDCPGEAQSGIQIGTTRKGASGIQLGKSLDIAGISIVANPRERAARMRVSHGTNTGRREVDIASGKGAGGAGAEVVLSRGDSAFAGLAFSEAGADVWAGADPRRSSEAPEGAGAHLAWRPSQGSSLSLRGSGSMRLAPDDEKSILLRAKDGQVVDGWPK